MDIWNFLSIFNKDMVNLSDYRKHVIDLVQSRYDVNEFYHLENNVNEMYWNLRDKLGNKKCYRCIKYNNKTEMDESIRLCKLKNHYYRSFINKIIMVDKRNKEIIYRPMEGSSNIFQKNKFNLLTMHILFDKELYDGVMNDQTSLDEIDVPEYYYQYDYAFPNLNCCKKNIYSKEEKKDRINHMYYTKSDKNWFKLVQNVENKK